MKTKFVVTAGCLLLLVAVWASGQAADRVRANIPFQFVVEGKTLPAGEYDFIRKTNEAYIQVAAVKKGPTVDVLVITRLSGDIHTTSRDAHVVFDKVGDTFYLSELWIAGTDGYLLRATKEKHEHRTINIPS